MTIEQAQELHRHLSQVVVYTVSGSNAVSVGYGSAKGEVKVKPPCCENCKYYDTTFRGTSNRGYIEGFGGCRRYPPNMQMKGVHGKFDWCGEFVYKLALRSKDDYS